MKKLIYLAVIGLLAAPAWATNYDVQMLAFNANGNIAGGGNFTITQQVAEGSAGSIPVENGNIVGGSVTSTLRFAGTSGLLNGKVVNIPREWMLAKDGHTFQSPMFGDAAGNHLYDPAQYPLAVAPGDPIPPAAMMGKDGSNSGGGITINIILWDMLSVASRTPQVGGGETIVYNVAGWVSVAAPPYGTFNPGFTGTMTLSSIPEPAAALLLLAGLPMLQRRRR